VLAQGERAQFTVSFTRPPSLAVDANGFMADSVQFFINPSFWAPGALRGADRVLTLWDPSGITIQDGGPDGGNQGGWGATIGTVPLKVEGRQLHFEVPFDLLGSTSFDYAVQVMHFGAAEVFFLDATGPTTYLLAHLGQAATIPEPTPSLLFVLGIGALAARAWRARGAPAPAQSSAPFDTTGRRWRAAFTASACQCAC
jgi:hypothetical protein